MLDVILFSMISGKRKALLSMAGKELKIFVSPRFLSGPHHESLSSNVGFFYHHRLLMLYAGINYSSVAGEKHQ